MKSLRSKMEQHRVSMGIVVVENEKDQYGRAGEEEFGGKKECRAEAQEPFHERVFLGGSVLDEVEREYAVGVAEKFPPFGRADLAPATSAREISGLVTYSSRPSSSSAAAEPTRSFEPNLKLH
jgi:hypothetical protein